MLLMYNDNDNKVFLTIILHWYSQSLSCTLSSYGWSPVCHQSFLMLLMYNDDKVFLTIIRHWFSQSLSCTLPSYG